jgi:transglutaminase-like putative cysteine protease
MLRRLVWVTGGLTLSVLPHVPHVKAWILLLAAGAASLRIVSEVKQWALLAKWLRSLLAFVALLAVLLDYRTLNGIDAGTALLIVMAGMKLLETRTVRDLTVVVFLSYFALFAAFLYNQSLLRLPYMLITAWLLTITLMRIHQTAAMSVREAVGITGRMFLQALPLAILLFLLFPRLPGQFWAVPARGEAVTGLSEDMSPGDVSELSISGALAFRAKFAGAMPPPAQRYWRGPVLHDFDGRTWRQPRTSFMPQHVTTDGATYEYDLMLEPHQRRWIFALDVATLWPGRRATRSADLQLLSRSGQPISTLTSFRLESATTYTVSGELPWAMRKADLLLPGGRNPRSVALARQLRERAGNDEAFIAAVLDKFRSEEYFYTLEPPRLELDSVDDFLFNTRRGFCEHFASAFTMLARAAGIPACVVTGYQGGEFNPMSGYLVLRQSDAHAWSEVWLEGRGWVRVDPTAAVAPDRIERGIDAALAEGGESLPGSFLRQSALLSQLRLAWDAANTFWNNQVVAFGEDQQRWLLERLNIGDAGWEQLGIGLALALIGFFAVMSLYLGWHFRPRAKDPLAQIYDQLCRKLARHGLPRAAHEGPSDYVARVLRARPDLAPLLVEARNLYVAMRYGPRSWGPQLASSELSRLKFLINQLKV